MITETTVLLSCFIITFGFIGYKLIGLVRKMLDKYRQQIEDSINESESLKMKAINAIEEAKKKEKFLTDEIEKMKDEANKKMNDIQYNFDTKLRELTEKHINENKDKVEMEKDRIIENFKIQIEECIKNVISEYSKGMSEEERNNAIKNAINKIDFKKLVG